MLTKSKFDEAVKPVKAEEITIHIGKAGWALFAEEAFQQGWDALYEACPWATVFQSRAFVATWYQTYRDKYLPIVAMAEHGGRLTGLLTLAAPVSGSKRGRIVGAGQYEAEYQTWLTEEPDNESFIKTALMKVLQLFPTFDIQLRYIPPRAPLQWIKEPYWKSRCVPEPYSRPLMDMSDPRIARMTRKTEFRNKFNRLKRLGTVSVEHVTNKVRFSELLDDLIVQYDFRQGALFNKNQFREEPLKVDLLLALFEQQLLHVSVLKVQEQIFSAIVAIDGHDWVHLGGINIHTPFHARFYSPGFVHFILFGQELAKAGVSIFDLTPGGDFYKERMATRHDQVNELVVTNSLKYRVKRQIRKQYHHLLLKAGKWPMGVELSVRKRIYLLKAKIRRAKKVGVLKTLLERIKNAFQHPQYNLYIATPDNLAKNVSLGVRKNSLRDLLLFESAGPGLTRWEFLEAAMHRLEMGQAAYTYSDGNRLLGCVWCSDPKSSRTGVLPNHPGGEAAVLLEDFYCHPEGRGRLADFVAAVVAAAMAHHRDGPLYVLAPGGDQPLCRTLESLGLITHPTNPNIHQRRKG